LKKIYHFIKDNLFYGIRTYTINKEKDEVLKRLEALHTKEYGYFLDKKSGFISHDDFKLTAADHSFFNRWFENNAAYLTGNVISEGAGKTRIVIKLRPNSACTLLFIVFMIMTIVFTIAFLWDPYKNSFWIPLFLLPTGILLPLGLVKITSLAFLEKFEAYMGIKPESAS
jgi:hypothetical protein